MYVKPIAKCFIDATLHGFRAIKWRSIQGGTGVKMKPPLTHMMDCYIYRKYILYTIIILYTISTIFTAIRINILL